MGMPKCITHYMHAKKVLKKLPYALVDGLDRDAYFWGAQGPDLFFTHRYLPFMRGKSISEYGERLHSEVKPSVLFRALRNYLTENADNKIAKAYVLGFVNHYVLDSRTHPYIHMLSAKLLEERAYETLTTMHAEIESALDTILLRKEAGKLPTEVKLAKFFPKNKKVQTEISKMYTKVIAEVFQETVSWQEVYQATADMRLVYTLLTDRSTMKMQIFSALEKGKTHKISTYILPVMENASIDYANFAQNEWIVDGEASEKDFFMLFQEAVSPAVDMITSFMSCDFAETTKEIPFG